MDYSNNSNVEEISQVNKPTYRRVGTITMGLALIITGALILYSLFHKEFDFTLAVKFAPVILIALGIEILVQYCLMKRGKIKYDILSILLCGILIFGSLGFAVAAPFLQYLSPEREAKELEIQQEFDKEVANRLEHLSFIQDADTSMSLSYAFPEDVTWSTAGKYCEYARVSVMLDTFPESKEAFANLADQVRKALADLPLNNTKIEIISLEKDSVKQGEVYQYFISLKSNYSKNKTIEQMISAVNEYTSDDEYEY